VSDDDIAPGWWQPYAAAFPRWHAWHGVNDLLYARLPLSSPPIVVSDRDAAGLAAKVRQAEESPPWWQRA
jgi:hypothetical protein